MINFSHLVYLQLTYPCRLAATIFARCYRRYKGKGPKGRSDWFASLHHVFLQDKRLFQCGSQEAGLVKYDKYTCKK